MNFILEIYETEDAATSEPPTKAAKEQKAEPEPKPGEKEETVAAMKKVGRPKKVADQQDRNGDSAKEVPAPAKGNQFTIQIACCFPFQ